MPLAFSWHRWRGAPHNSRPSPGAGHASTALSALSRGVYLCRATGRQPLLVLVRCAAWLALGSTAAARGRADSLPSRLPCSALLCRGLPSVLFCSTWRRRPVALCDTSNGLSQRASCSAKAIKLVAR